MRNGAALLGSGSTPAVPFISYGPETTFQATSTRYVSIAQMNSTQAIVAYLNEPNSNALTVCLLTVSGNVVLMETPLQVATNSPTYTYNISICRMDATHAIVVYTDGPAGNPENATAFCITLTGTVLSASIKYKLTIANSFDHHISVTSLSSTKAIVTHHNQGMSYYGRAQCLTLTGDVITPGTPVTFNPATTVWTSVVAVNSTQAIVTTGTPVTLGTSYAYCLTLDGVDDLLVGPQAVIRSSEQTEYISTCKMANDKAFFTSQNQFYQGDVVQLTLSGNVVTPSLHTIFETETQNRGTAIVRLTDSLALVASMNGSPSGGRCNALDYDGASITTVAKESFVAGEATVSNQLVSMCSFSASTCIVCYRSPANGFGCAKVVTIT